MPATYQTIGTPDALRRLAERARDEACLAIDTEFVWESTYFARLGLVQIGLADGTCGLIDPLAVPDLSPVGDLLADARIVKILHDAPQDLMILRRATGASARNVFDTRKAAGFAGLPSTLSLGNLLAGLLGVHLAKAHTRADWIARPLAPEVLEYAADDVRHLPAAADQLRARARTAGVEAWLDEEFAAFDAPPLPEEAEDAVAYLRIRAAASLGPRPLAALRELAAWRERAARAADRPRRWIAEDGALAAVASAMPRTADDLRRCRGLEPKAAARHGDDWLAAVARAFALPDADLPPPVFQSRRDAAFRKALDAEFAAIQERAARLGIDPALVCSRNDLAKRLQAGPAARPEDHALLRGWRAEFMAGPGPTDPRAGP